MRGRRSIDNENMVEWATAKHDKRDTQCEGSIPVQKWRQVRHNIKMWTFKLKATGSSNQVPIATDKDTSSKVTEVFVVSFAVIWEIHCFTRPLSSA